MNGRVGTQQVEGTVEATNAKGLKIGGAWVNVSQFHPVDLPEAGAHVRLEIDSKGYIRTLEALKMPVSETPTSAHDVRNHAHDVRNHAHDVRLAVLQAAASFLGQMAQCREDVRSEHLLMLATKWLAWVEEERS